MGRVLLIAAVVCLSSCGLINAFGGGPAIDDVLAGEDACEDAIDELDRLGCENFLDSTVCLGQPPSCNRFWQCVEDTAFCDDGNIASWDFEFCDEGEC